MFLIYKSNRLDPLINQACNIIKKNPLSDPFQNEIFLVSNKETTQWIKLFIAEKLKISANIKFFTIYDFIWTLFGIAVPNLASQKKLNTSSIIWKIMASIDKRKITGILNKKDSQLKKFMFSSYISDLFQQYLIYRPDWIYSWEKEDKYLNINKDHQWQKNLWNILINNYWDNPKYLNFSNLLSMLLKKIKNSRSSFSLIPFRFFICNISDIPISYLSALYSLSKYYTIHLLMTTPYINNHFIIKKENNKKKSHLCIYSKKKYYDLHEQYYRLGIINQINPLVLSCGQYGYEYESFFLLMKNKYINCFTSTYDDTVLHNVQKNILKIINKKNINKDKIFDHKKIKKIILNPKDQSISIHICYNIQREVEILHDNLLNILNKNSLILTKDIIVKAFQLNIYIPFINSVFNSESSKHRIPFIIFNEVSDKKNEILFIFNTLLNLEKNRLYNQEIFDLLQSSTLAKHFCIDKKEIPVLFNIIYESGIRWGIDQKHLYNLSLPDDAKHTWQHGIKRIILGYTNHDKKISWNNIFPYEIKNKSHIPIICKIIYFIQTINKWKKKLSTLKLLKTWLPICHQLIDDFFYRNSETEGILDNIERKWIKIINNGIQSDYKKKFLFQYYEINYF